MPTRPGPAATSATGALGEVLHRLPSWIHRSVPPEQRADLRHLVGRYRPWERGAHRSAPLAPPGELTGPPDFVGVGVPHAGTRWWYRLIAAHPGVSSRPELPIGLHYFSRFATDRFDAESIAWYHRWFPRRPGTIAGEWTASYLSDLWVAPLLARAAPEARVLVLVRDPVERLLSALAQRAGEAGSHPGSENADAVDRGFYGLQLARLLTAFASEQVHVLQYERCVADPAGQLSATYRFLGLDDGHRPVELGSSPAWSGRTSRGVDPSTAGRLAELYAADADALAGLAPGVDLSLWNRRYVR
ncbi:MAG: sulfotransferase family protein [Acidimicrobiales bacterium]